MCTKLTVSIESQNYPPFWHAFRTHAGDCKANISDKYPPLGLSAVSKALHFLEKTFHSKLSPKCFWSLTMARKPQRYHCQKNSHYLFHLNRHFCLRANDIARNRSRVIFSRACADIFRRWTAIVVQRIHACASVPDNTELNRVVWTYTVLSNDRFRKRDKGAGINISKLKITTASLLFLDERQT